MRLVILAILGVIFAAPAAAGDWRLVWSDEFNGTGLPDPAQWTYEEGFIRNNELQFYTKARQENVRRENGLLIIEARKERFDNPFHREGSNRRGERKNTADYTSASLTTEGKASWSHGRIEVRAKLPAGRGTWPAIWLLGTGYRTAGWPKCGEIDIMEHVGHDPGIVHANIHTQAYNHVQRTNKGDKITVDQPSRSFHTYSVEWSNEQMDFFAGDKKYFSFKNEKTGVDVWPFDKPHYLILNIAIGGSWGGQKGVDDSIFPQRMEIDYVRVYQRTAP